MQPWALAFFCFLAAGTVAAADDQVRPEPGHPPYPSLDAPPPSFLPDLKTLEGKPEDGKATEPKSDESNKGDAKTGDSKTGDSKTAHPKPADAKQADTKDVKKVPDAAPAPKVDATTKSDTAKPAPDKPVSRSKSDSAHHGDAPRARVCFNPTETREKIASHRLAEPFRALKKGNIPGEALRVRLCRWKTDEFVYEISVLRRDGRIAHVYMNAQSGQLAGTLNDGDKK